MHSDPTDQRPDKPEEACGIYAVLAPGEPVANLTYFGLYSLQHRGQESAGIAVFDAGHKVRLHKDMGLVSQVFDQDVLERLVGDLAIGHNRYSTTGSSKVCYAQPVVLMTRLGPCALAHNGNLVNAAELRLELADIASELTSTTDSELIAFAIQQAVNGGCDWDGAIRHAASRCRGAFSLVIGTPQGLFALRDGHGIRPLVSGVKAAGPAFTVKYRARSVECGSVGDFIDDVEPGQVIVKRERIYVTAIRQDNAFLAGEKTGLGTRRIVPQDHPILDRTAISQVLVYQPFNLIGSDIAV